VTAGAFADPQALLLASVGEKLAGQVFNQALNAKVRADAKAERQAEIAGRFRVEDAYNELQNKALDIQSSFTKLKGKSALEQENGRTLEDNVLSDFNRQKSTIADSLGDDFQKQLFNQRASDLQLSLRSKVIGHEADQYRVFQDSTLKGKAVTAQNSLNLNYNDPKIRAESVNAIRNSYVDLALLHGQDPALGEAQGDDAASQALKLSVASALQNNDHQTALGIYDQFKEHFSADDRIAIESNIGKDYAQRVIANDPQRLINEISGISSKKITAEQAEKAILFAEGGKDNFDANGQPSVSSDGLSIGTHQVTDKTAQAPGFGIVPARERTHAEYNRIGKELIVALTEKYDGDAQKIFAAYNAGSGAVDNAIERGGENWRQFIPEATREKYLPRAGSQLGKTGTPIDLLTFDQKQNALHEAASQIAHSQNVFKAELVNNTRNQIAALQETGVLTDVAKPEQFQQAYGQDWQRHFEKYKQDISYAENYYSLGKMPLPQANLTLEANKPQPGDPNFPERQKKYDAMDSALAAINSQREKDPIAWGEKNGYEINRINPAQANQVTVELMTRVEKSQILNDNYGTPYKLLTNDEAVEMSDIMNKGTDGERITLLKSIKSGLDDYSFSIVMDQMKIKNDSIRVAGFLAANGHEDVAKIIFNGDKLLNPEEKGTTFSIPNDFNKAFNDEIGEAYQDFPEQRIAILSAMRAYYAGSGQEDSDEGVTAGMEAILGIDELAENGGVKIVQPYGMDKDDFIEQAGQKWKDQVKDTYLDAYDFDDLAIAPIGPNQYAIRNGNDYLYGQDNRPVILDFSQ
jgi:hypothetical protein